MVNKTVQHDAVVVAVPEQHGQTSRLDLHEGAPCRTTGFAVRWQAHTATDCPVHKTGKERAFTIPNVRLDVEKARRF
jgi:hypothetical protein